MMRWGLGLVCAGLLLGAGLRAQSGAPANGEWPTYGADLGQHAATRRSTQINAGQLQQARGRVALQDRQPRPAPRVQARRDAADGQRRASTRPPARAARWSRSTPRPASCCGCTASSEGARGAAAPRQLSGRGLSYWTDGRDDAILYVTPGYRLVALNAKTGALVTQLRQERRRRSEDATIDQDDRSGHRRDRPPLDADRRQRRRHRRLGASTPAASPQSRNEHEGARPRLRRAHRQAAVDLQHDSAARRVRQRHVGEGFVGVHRQHRRVGADHGRRGARPRSTCRSRLPTARLLRRPSPRQQPVRREHRRRRSEDRAAQVALPARPSRHVGHRHPVRRRSSRDITVNGRTIKAAGAADQAGFLYVLRSRDRPADLADRGAAGAERRHAGRMVFADAAVPDQAAGLRRPAV